ncbi:hypothetical protein QOT17_008450 [Balamuthia mandrillaris]
MQQPQPADRRPLSTQSPSSPPPVSSSSSSSSSSSWREQAEARRRTKAPKPQKQRPNYFLAVRLQQPAILEAVALLQRRLEAERPHWRRFFTRPSRFHITLFVLTLSSLEDVQLVHSLLESFGTTSSTSLASPSSSSSYSSSCAAASSPLLIDEKNEEKEEKEKEQEKEGKDAEEGEGEEMKKQQKKRRMEERLVGWHEEREFYVRIKGLGTFNNRGSFVLWAALDKAFHAIQQENKEEAITNALATKEEGESKKHDESLHPLHRLTTALYHHFRSSSPQLVPSRLNFEPHATILKIRKDFLRRKQRQQNHHQNRQQKREQHSKETREGERCENDKIIEERMNAEGKEDDETQNKENEEAKIMKATTTRSHNVWKDDLPSTLEDLLLPLHGNAKNESNNSNETWQQHIFGEQIVTCVELLKMEGFDEEDGGYPCFGRWFLNPSAPSSSATISTSTEMTSFVLRRSISGSRFEGTKRSAAVLHQLKKERQKEERRQLAMMKTTAKQEEEEVEEEREGEVVEKNEEKEAQSQRPNSEQGKNVFTP